MGLFDSLFESESEVESRMRSDPWGPAAGGLQRGAGLISSWMGRPQEFFPGQTYAGATPEQLQAIEQMKAAAGQAGGMMPAITGGYLGALGRPEAVLGQGLQDVASNPYLAGIADVMEARSQERMLEDVLPQMEATAVGRGGLGGSRLAIGAQQAERDRQRALDDALAGLYGQAWQQGLGAETQRYNQALAGATSALGQTPTILGALQAPGQQLWGAGGLERAEEQRAIDEAMQRFQFEQMEPYTRGVQGMQALMPAATAFGQQEGTTTTTNTPSTFGQIGQMVGLGAGLIGGIGGMGAMGGGMGPFGAAGGYGMGPMGYGMGYGISPYGQQAQMLNQQWGSPLTSMWG